MDRIMRARPTPSMVISMIALFVALSGTAVALDGSNTVFSDDIVNGEVRSADLAANSVATPDLATGAVTAPKLAAQSVNSANVLNESLLGIDIAEGGVGAAEIAPDAVAGSEVADSSLTGADIADESLLDGDDIAGITGADINTSSLDGNDVAGNGLTGTDINESTLGAVPNATNAANANEVDGLGARSFEFQGGTGAVTTVVMSQGGLVLKADCDSGPNVEVFAESDINSSYFHAVNLTLSGSIEHPATDSSFDNGEANKQIASPGDGFGTVVFRDGPDSGTDTTSDDTVTVRYSYEEGGSGCHVIGTATGGPS